VTRVLGVQRFFQMLGQYIWREKIAYTCKLYRVHCGLALTRELGLVNQYLFFISFMPWMKDFWRIFMILIFFVRTPMSKSTRDANQMNTVTV